MSSERSILRVRTRPHTNPDRSPDEVIVEVIRNGKVAATIYGAREGIHVASEYASNNQPFFFQSPPGLPTIVVPLLADEEECPWCQGSGTFLNDMPCPVCHARREEHE